MPTKPFLGSCSATRRTTIRVWKVISTLFGSSVRRCIDPGRRGGALDRQGRGPAAQADTAGIAAATLPARSSAGRAGEESKTPRGIGEPRPRGAVRRYGGPAERSATRARFPGSSRPSIWKAACPANRSSWPWANSKAQEALPRLYALFVDAKNSENSTRGRFLIANAAAEQTRLQREAVGQIESIGEKRERDRALRATRRRRAGSKGLLSLVHHPGIDRKDWAGRVAGFLPQARGRVRWPPAGARRPAACDLPHRRYAAGNAKVLPRNAGRSRRSGGRRGADQPHGPGGPFDAGADSSRPERSQSRHHALASARTLLRVSDGRKLVFARGAIAAVVNDPANGPYDIHDVRELLERIPDKE